MDPIWFKSSVLDWESAFKTKFEAKNEICLSSIPNGLFFVLLGYQGHNTGGSGGIQITENGEKMFMFSLWCSKEYQISIENSSEDAQVLNHGDHIQLTKEEPISEIDGVNVIQRLTGELQEGSTDLNQTWHISCEFEYGSNVVRLGTIKWSGSRHPLNGPKFYSNAISSCQSEQDFEEIISKIKTPVIGNGEEKFQVEKQIPPKADHNGLNPVPGMIEDQNDDVVDGAENSTDGNERTEVGSEWRDSDFDLKSSKNAGTKIGKLWPEATFIHYQVTPTDGIDETDIQQGDELGDCWFLAALASLAMGNRDGKPNKARLHALEHVIQIENNIKSKAMKDGRFAFQFYRLGRWETVEIDNILPLSRRARRTDDNEWWVCLVEKAYAKFNGSYDSIEGGFTSWALTELTGGISIEMNKLTTSGDKELEKRLNGFDLFELMEKLWNKCIVTSSNYGGSNEKIVRGLVCGHAYSLIGVERVKTSNGEVRLVKIRNPWGETEWTGDWSDHRDGKDEWKTVSDEEKNRIGYNNKNDGSFWMTFQDWINEFELCTICIMHESCDDFIHWFDVDHNNIDGTSSVPAASLEKIESSFLGSNRVRTVNDMASEFGNPKMYHHAILTVGENYDFGRLVFLQILLECRTKETKFVMINVTKVSEDYDNVETVTTNTRSFKNQLFRKLVNPVMPLTKGLQITRYCHNGYLYNFEANSKYLISFMAAPEFQSQKDEDYCLRAFGKNISLKLL